MEGQVSEIQADLKIEMNPGDFWSKKLVFMRQHGAKLNEYIETVDGVVTSHYTVKMVDNKPVILEVTNRLSERGEFSAIPSMFIGLKMNASILTDAGYTRVSRLWVHKFEPLESWRDPIQNPGAVYRVSR